MSEKWAIKKSTLDNIGNAIREKEGSTEEIPVNALADRITALNVGGGENKLNLMLKGEPFDLTKADLEGVTAIADYTFYTNKAIVSVDFPDSIESIGESAFWSASNLTTLYFPDKPITIGGNAFQNALVSAVHIKSLNNWFKTTFKNRTSSPLNTKEAHLYLNNEVITDVIYPSDMEATGLVMCGYKGLNSVYIPANIKTISADSFRECKGLKKVTMEEGVITIASSAFYGAENIAEITIPNSVTSIGDGALQIGYGSRKATITFLGTTPPTISTNTLPPYYLNKIIVPAGCGEAYKTATNWADFADYIEEATE